MKTFLTILSIIIPLFLFSQIQDNSLPFAFKENINFDSLNFYEIKEFNPEKLLENNKNNSFIKPFPIAKAYKTDLEIQNSSKIYKENDKNIKYLKITAPKATSMALIFDNFYLSKNEKIYIFNVQKTHFIGALTYKNNKKSNILSTRFIPGDTILVEYHSPQKFKSDLSISYVAAAYKDLYNGSQWCEVNINCDLSIIWQKVKKSVAKFVYKDDNNSYYVCTGSLVANTKLDNTPYFLTANHCINSQDEANSAVFYFNYESENCSGSSSHLTQTISGSDLLSTADDKLDFSLLRLSITPPSVYNPYYTGWSRVKFYQDTSVCIHHPQGDIKKISKNYNPLKVSDFSGYDYNKHWQVEQWNEGSTEAGSSGSGIFTTEGLLIGTLSGGDASCDYNYNDLFQQFYHSWDDYNAYNKQLEHWLDPFGFDPEKISGYFVYENTDLNVPQNFQAHLQDSIVTISWEKPKGNPDKYIIYKNLNKIDEFDYPQVIFDVLDKPNVYVYFATAVYGNRESKPSVMKSMVFGDTSSIPKVTDIRIYPNPTAEDIKIITPDTLLMQKIQIVNYDGKIVLNKNLNNLNYTVINIETLKPSWYFVRIFSESCIYNRKIIKYRKEN